jgi:hypothetical protein
MFKYLNTSLSSSENTLETVLKGDNLARFHELGCFDNLAYRRFLALFGPRHVFDQKLPGTHAHHSLRLCQEVKDRSPPCMPVVRYLAPRIPEAIWPRRARINRDDELDSDLHACNFISISHLQRRDRSLLLSIELLAICLIQHSGV